MALVVSPLLVAHDLGVLLGRIKPSLVRARRKTPMPVQCSGWIYVRHQWCRTWGEWSYDCCWPMVLENVDGSVIQVWRTSRKNTMLDQCNRWDLDVLSGFRWGWWQLSADVLWQHWTPLGRAAELIGSSPHKLTLGKLATESLSKTTKVWPSSTYWYYVYCYVYQFIPSGTVTYYLSCPLHISCIHYRTTLYHIDCPHMTFTTHFTHYTFHWPFIHIPMFPYNVHIQWYCIS